MRFLFIWFVFLHTVCDAMVPAENYQLAKIEESKKMFGSLTEELDCTCMPLYVPNIIKEAIATGDLTKVIMLNEYIVPGHGTPLTNEWFDTVNSTIRMLVPS